MSPQSGIKISILQPSAAWIDVSQHALGEISFRHISFGVSVKPRQLDGGVSVEKENDLITATISM